MKASALKPNAQDRTLLEDVVGYLNFSSGAGEPKFLHQINELYRSLEAQGPQEDSLPQFCEWLSATIERLQAAGGLVVSLS